MLLGTLGSSLLGNILTHKGVKATITVRGVMRPNKITIRAGKDF